MTSPAAAETIRIEAANRWDALDLVQRLEGLHTYLVQLGDRRWVICVRFAGEPANLVGDVRRAAEEWATQRHLASVTMQVGPETYEIPS